MASVKIEIYPWLSSAFGSKRPERLVLNQEIAEDETMGSLLKRLADAHKEFATLAFDERVGDLSGHVSIIINGRLMELAGGLEAKLKDEDLILLLPAFDGGLV